MEARRRRDAAGEDATPNKGWARSLVGPVEVCAYVAVLAFLLYARTRTHLAHGKRRWGITYSLLALVFTIWLLRIAHLILYGRDR